MSLRSLDSITASALPEGVWFSRIPGRPVECWPLATAEADLFRLSADDLHATLCQRTTGTMLTGVRSLREWFRACLLRGALSNRGTELEPEFSGARLLRNIAETIAGDGAERPSSSPSADPAWARERAELWQQCHRTTPLPAMPDALTMVENTHGPDGMVWLAGKLMHVYFQSAVDVGPIAAVRGSIADEVRSLEAYEPLRQLIGQRPRRRERVGSTERAADWQFATQLAGSDEIRGRVSPYHPIRIRPEWGADSARLTVRVPAHIAETGIRDWHVYWPASEIGTTIQLGETYSCDTLLQPLTVSSPDEWCPLQHHPLVNSENVVCVADSAALTGTQLAHSGATIGEIAAQMLLTVRDTILYGYHARHGTTVYNRYADSIPERLESRRLGARAALRRSRAENIEIIPWNR
jgi:hypothetical protein